MPICLIVGDSNCDSLAKMTSVSSFHLKSTTSPFVTNKYLQSRILRLGKDCLPPQCFIIHW